MPKHLGVFVSKEDHLMLIACFETSRSSPIGSKEVGKLIDDLRKKYKMPYGTGVNLKTGEFIAP